jgi:hypothetical protein
MATLNWTCPHCQRDVTITGDRQSEQQHVLWVDNADGPQVLESRFFVCPNAECRKFTLFTNLFEGKVVASSLKIAPYPSHSWTLVPEGQAKVFPTYIPAPILEDYREACLIKDLSPKASATLSRRCLQGIIRDYWGVKPARLVDEIKAIQSQVDPLTWDAIEAVRKIGNIGAHMENDINVIVAVDPSEAGLLIDLVETLLEEWYVARENRAKRMGSLINVAASKKGPPSFGTGKAGTSAPAPVAAGKSLPSAPPGPTVP